MNLELQKGSFLKRIAAYLADFILLSIIIVGAAWGLSVVTDTEKHSDKIADKQAYYEELHGVSFEIEEEDYNKLSEEDRKIIDDAYEEFQLDQEVIYAYNMLFYLSLSITSVSILIGFLIVEFILPIIFKNGQTLGKKVFGIGVMQTNGVRLSTVALFARSILGKCVVETMIPVLTLVLALFGNGGGLIISLFIMIFNIILVIATKTNSFIHDILSFTVVIDMPSQRIFNTEQDLIDYKKKIHEETVAKSSYF